MVVLIYFFLFNSFNFTSVSRPKTSLTISIHLKGQLGPRVSNEKVFVCLSVKKMSTFLNNPASVKKMFVCLYVMKNESVCDDGDDDGERN